MAYDKVVDSTILDNNLKSVADAIREKAGVSGEFLFPTDFIAVINSIQAGGGGGDDTIDKLISREITEVTSNATKVGDYAFSQCKKLTTANFPLATSLGASAFSSCSKLTTANVPLATSLGDHAFAYCTRLTTADFPSVTSTGKYSFNGCSNLTTADFPLATSVGSYAFSSCSNLTTVDFPLLTSIESSVFSRCTNLTTANFPLATSLGTYAFEHCYSLTTLILRSETMATLSNKNAFQISYHFHGTVNSTYNPEGLKDGYIYVPRALLSDTDETKDYRRATNWSTLATQFRALEDYTVDGTITGELDPNKI